MKMYVAMREGGRMSCSGWVNMCVAVREGARRFRGG